MIWAFYWRVKDNWYYKDILAFICKIVENWKDIYGSCSINARSCLSLKIWNFMLMIPCNDCSFCHHSSMFRSTAYMLPSQFQCLNDRIIIYGDLSYKEHILRWQVQESLQWQEQFFRYVQRVIYPFLYSISNSTKREFKTKPLSFPSGLERILSNRLSQ